MKPFFTSPIAFLAFALLHVGQVVVMAAELPEDTNKIESLTADDAKKLIAREEAKEKEEEAELEEDEIRKMKCLQLAGLKQLEANVAKVLADYNGELLWLNGLPALDATAAKALAEFKGHLWLHGVAALDTEASKALADFKGESFSLGLTTLDTHTAKALASNAKWDGQLPCFTAFESPDSIAVARALAARKGSLSFSGLKKISPKTLSALIEKDDVEIPLIETLELIQEPDGSVTEDFVIPESFQKGQQKQSK
jgi:hypothetical protein